MISSEQNDIVKHLVRLRSRRHRDRDGLFVIEGARIVARALATGVDIVEMFVCPDLGGALPGTNSVTEMTEAPFRKASIRQNPDGVMALAHHLDTRLERLAHGTCVMVVEALEKPGNLGAILRTADAVGVDALVCCDPTTDIHNPNVVRASQGALFSVPLAVADVDATLTWLRAGGISLVATSPGADADLWDADLTGPVAIAVGAEADGLTRSLLARADVTVRIPMRGTTVDSLNASVSAAVVLYEVVRQRL